MSGGKRLRPLLLLHAATICGFSRSVGEWVITLDDDLEQNPEEIPALFAKAQEGYQLVYGVYGQRAHSVWRNLTSEIARRMFRFAIPSLNYEYTSFRVINGRLARETALFFPALYKGHKVTIMAWNNGLE